MGGFTITVLEKRAHDGHFGPCLERIFCSNDAEVLKEVMERERGGTHLLYLLRVAHSCSSF